jgi:hypothetical protein
MNIQSEYFEKHCCWKPVVTNMWVCFWVHFTLVYGFLFWYYAILVGFVVRFVVCFEVTCLQFFSRLFCLSGSLLTILILPIHEHGTSYLFVCVCSISFSSVLQFSPQSSFTSLIKFIYNFGRGCCFVLKLFWMILLSWLPF